MSTFKNISLNISGLSYAETRDKILYWAKTKEPSYVCFANAHMTIEAHDDSNFAKQVNNANLVCADGMALVKAIQMQYGQKIERSAGMDMMPTLIEAAAKQEIKVFFYGTTNDVLDQIKLKATHDHPSIQIAGSFSPPFKKLTEEEKKEHIDMINNSGAGMVFVALGCPKQEKWMAENSASINAVLLGVGGAFPVYVNLQKRAPAWIRNLSLEWLFRLVQDPKRLFKRYFYTNSKFLFLFAKQLLFKKKPSLAKD